MSINEIREFFFEKFFKGIEFSQENNYYSMKRLKKKKDLLLFVNKLIENIPPNRNDKIHYQSFIKMKNPKSVKESEIITY